VKVLRGKFRDFRERRDEAVLLARMNVLESEGWVDWKRGLADRGSRDRLLGNAAGRG